MSASRFEPADAFPEVRVETPDLRFSLAPSQLRLRRHGVEFKSPAPFPVWAEMTVVLETPARRDPLRCTGVVVACDGNRHGGYAVAVLFLDLLPWSEERRGWTAGAPPR